jgi:outer membrane protein assembly factor BamB
MNCTMKPHPACPALRALLLAVAASFPSPAAAENWPCWRGPRSDNISLEKGVPTRWEPADAVWKTVVPGEGHASPIVWKDRIYTVTGLPEKQDRQLVCFDRATGNILWQQTVVHGPLERLHPENTHASGTPATDGRRVYVNFRVGDEIVVAAHDATSGEQLWSVRPGTHEGEWGFSNAPLLYKDKVIIDGDSKGKSFLVALNRDNGRTLWRVDRTHRGISYAAPLVREMAGRVQLIQCGDRCVTSFDPDTGKPIWKVDGPSEEFVASPAYSEKAGLVFASSSYPIRQVFAIKPDGRGDVTKSHVAWEDKIGSPYISSPLIVGDWMLALNNAGIAFCYDAATGKVLWKARLGRHHASPVLVEGLAFFIADNGEVNVIKPGVKFERVAQYQLGESCYASPAISNGQVFLRGFKHLFCFGKGTP